MKSKFFRVVDYRMKDTSQKEVAKVSISRRYKRLKKTKDGKQDKRAEIELATATAKSQSHEESDLHYWHKKLRATTDCSI